MSFQTRPSKKTIDSLRIALGKAKDVGDDRDRARAIWRDFRWRMSTLDGTYETIFVLIENFIERAKTELASKEVRDKVLKRFEEMKSRLSEFHEDDEPSE